MARKQTTKQTEKIIYIYPEDIAPENSDNNPKCCLNPVYFYEKTCHKCRYVNNCIYENKYQYERLHLK